MLTVLPVANTVVSKSLVVLPTYNERDNIEPIVAAILGQSPDFEVLVVDDCSGDETERVLKSLMDEAPFRLRSLRTPANGGPAVARNIGWQAAAAPLLAFIDDDSEIRGVEPARNLQ